MFVGQPAWHGLGVVVNEAQTSRQAITLAGLDWDVAQLPVRAYNPDADEYYGTDKIANVRMDTNRVLGVVTSSYRVFQNRECFDFFDSIVGDRLAMYETAGAIHDGKVVWMLARVPKEYRVGDDLIQPYILLANSHDGSKALRMIPTTVRVVCQNTLNLALNRADSTSGVTIYHWPNLERQVHDARRALGIVSARFDSFDEELHRMIARPFDSTDLDTYVEALFPEPSEDKRTDRKMKSLEAVRDEVKANFDNERQTLRGIKHTAWAAYNAVSEYADHSRILRGRTNAEVASNRLNSAWFGTGNSLKQRAYGLALEMATA